MISQIYLNLDIASAKTHYVSVSLKPGSQQEIILIEYGSAIFRTRKQFPPSPPVSCWMLKGWEGFRLWRYLTSHLCTESSWCMHDLLWTAFTRLPALEVCVCVCVSVVWRKWVRRKCERCRDGCAPCSVLQQEVHREDRRRGPPGPTLPCTCKWG